MHVVCCQYDIAWEDKPANFAKVNALLEQASLEPESLIVLPEMSFTGFSMDVDRIAENPGGHSEIFLGNTARKHRVFIAGGIVTRGDDARGRNQLVVFSPDGSEVARYSKIQPFTLGDESNHYTGGDAVVTFRCGSHLVSPFICYDLRFPELFRIAAAQRPELFVVIANWPVARIGHWTRLLQARAIENQAFVVGVNRCGHDPRYEYSGGSIVVNPHGDILAEAGQSERTIRAHLDFVWLDQYRRDLPFLNDMGDLKARFGAHSRT